MATHRRDSNSLSGAASLMAALVVLSFMGVANSAPVHDTWPWGMRAATFFAPLRLKISEAELEDRIALLQRLGYDTLVIGVQHFPLDYMPEWPQLVERSALIAATAHRHGMKVIEHHSAGVFHTDHLDDEWNGHELRELSPVSARTGEADRYIETMIFACPNNPLHWQLYSEYARRLMVEAHVDAFMADDVEILHDTFSCVCPHCRGAFRKQYRVELPPPTDETFWGNYGNRGFRQWLRFRQQSVRGFHHHMKQLRDEVAPQVRLLTCQCEPAGTALPVLWALAHDEIAPELDVLFLEGMNAVGYAADWAYHASDLKLLQAMGQRRKPVFPLYYPMSPKNPYLVVFSSQPILEQLRPHGRYSNEVGKATGAYERAEYSDPLVEPGSEETFFLWAFNRMFADGWWVSDNFDLAAEGLAFQNAHADLYPRTKNLTSIALHYSRQTRDSYGGLSNTFHVDEWRGWAMTLLQHNWPFDVVLDEDLKRPLPPSVRLLILPNSACLSDGQVKQINRFVQHGGRVIATGDAALYTDEGTRRDDFALGNLLGIHHESTQRGVKAQVMWSQATREVLEGVPSSMQANEDVTVVRPGAKAQPLGTIRGQDWEGCAAVVSQSRRTLYLGGKAGLLGSPQRPERVDKEHVRWVGPRDAGWQQLLVSCVRWGVRDTFPLRLVNAPPGLVLSASESGHRVVAQLLHTPARSVGEVFDPTACALGVPQPASGDGIELRMRRRPTRVTLYSPDLAQPMPLSVHQKSTEWSVTLSPEALRRYAVVVWER
ncbi:MAG: hypothetical protein HY318_00730 [Armatimonadetes bacterium]|nr:hypothetical protein [Armatimonadota bacterium]